MGDTKHLSRLAAQVAFVLALAATTPVLAGDHSGFLQDYSRLEKEEDALGVKRHIWVSPKLTGVNYRKLLVEPVTYYPEPELESGKDVSGEVLTQIRDYLDATLRKVLGDELPLVDAPGPGVARVRLAITAVDVKKGLKPRELVPIGMVRAGAKEATGRRKHDVELFVETEITDSVTKEELALVVRESKGIEHKGNDPLTLEDFKPQIDAWGEAARQEIMKRLK